MTAARNYSNIAASAVLTSGCSGVDTTIQVDTTAGFPSVPFVLVIDKDRVAEELVLVTAIVGLALTVTRGFGGTSAATHSAAATVKHVFTGTDAQDAGDHIGDSTLHWNSTNTDTLALPWQWSKPGAVVPSMVTGVPTSITAAGPTTIVAGPSGGRRVLKHLLVSGASGSTVTLTLASKTLLKFDFTSTSIASLEMALPIANGENLQATVSSGTCVFTPAYGDRSDTALDRVGYLSSSSTSSTDIVASGTARTITSWWLSNPTTNTATVEVLIGTQSITGVLSLPAKTAVFIDDPIILTNTQALKGKADGTNAITFLAIGY